MPKASPTLSKHAAQSLAVISAAAGLGLAAGGAGLAVA